MNQTNYLCHKVTEYKVEMYLRLSRDDERAGGSLSIDNFALGGASEEKFAPPEKR